VTSSTFLDAWLRRYREVPRARARLVCFPYAGGGATVFRLWSSGLPLDVEVIAIQYPGRQDRYDEPVIDEMAAMVEPIRAALDRLPARPTVLFGHSMGASIAYETSLRLAVPPRLLVVSGHNAPHRAARKPVPRTEDEVIAEVRAVDGPHETLADPELRELVMPALHGDYRLIRGYLPAPGPRPVPVPIVAYTGTLDPTAQPEQVRAWAELCTGDFELVSFPGGHFFLESHTGEVLADLSGRLTDAVR
jgi:pyochelin biosynthesis protein PchC